MIDTSKGSGHTLHLLRQAATMSLSSALFVLPPSALEVAKTSLGKNVDIRFLMSRVPELPLLSKASYSCPWENITPYPGTSSIVFGCFCNVIIYIPIHVL